MTMHCEMPEQTFAEKKALFEIFWMGREEARRGLPLRAGHDLSTAEQRQYRGGHASWEGRDGHTE